MSNLPVGLGRALTPWSSALFFLYNFVIMIKLLNDPVEEDLPAASAATSTPPVFATGGGLFFYSGQWYSSGVIL
jgi:hypothetical protein